MSVIRTILRVLIALIGLFFTIGGIYHISVGGEFSSYFYTVLGVLTLISAILLFKNRMCGFWLAALALVLSIIWALYERGFNFWAFEVRVLTPLGVAILAYFAVKKAQLPKLAVAVNTIFVLGFIAIFAGLFTSHTGFTSDGKWYKPHESNEKPDNWYAYGRTSDSQRFAPFTQINRDNVDDLEVAWEYHNGDKGPGSEQNVPLQIGNMLYTCSKNGIVAAIDADTGKQIWSFDSGDRAPVQQRCRSVGYFDLRTNSPHEPTGDNVPPSEPGSCTQRIIAATPKARFAALDALNGQLCKDFGQDGYVDAKENLGEVKPGYYIPTTGPTMAKDMFVFGAWIWDNQEVGEPSGVIRAFDSKTGELRWAWDLAEPRTDKEPFNGKEYTRETPNSWPGMTYDEKTETLFIPLGNQTPDFYGYNRSDVVNDYASSTVALNVNNGKEKWHYQTTHYDLWDYDVSSPPVVMDDIKSDYTQKPTRSVLQPTKRAQLFVLDLENGKPVAEVEEKDVNNAKSPIDKEKPLSKTQPYSTGMPYAFPTPDNFTEDSTWGMTLFDQLMCRTEFKRDVVYEGDFTPVGYKKTLAAPGNHGGYNWGGASYDPQNQVVYLNDERIPAIYQMIPQKDYPKLKEDGKTDPRIFNVAEQRGTPSGIIKALWLTALGTPCSEPSFGNVLAIDMKTRKILWEAPVGTPADTEIKGVPIGLPVATGMPTYAGVTATAGGLVFFAGSQDFYLRAYDAATGKEVWKYRLPVGASATPMSYISPKTGTQYIVVTVGGAAHSPKTGDYVIAFALKDKIKKDGNKQAAN